MTRNNAWWKDSTVYQIYPRSFKDTNGDGVGDLPGIAEKLDYIDDLGVDLVWLNPVYDSPVVDNGYDIRNYREILDDYGTMADWRDLRDGLHERDIGLVMDLVVNHTSDQHEWFQRSRREEDEYRDYYWWVEGDMDEPPNNWESFFGGPAWSYDHERGAWYLHLFDETQPDLNWRSPDVREDVYEMMRWWLEKDIDGFRMDVINLLSKPEDLPDGDPDADLVGQDQFVTGPRIHEYIREMHDRVLADYDIMTVGETPQVTVDEAKQFLDDGLDMVFSFKYRRVDVDEQVSKQIGKGEEGPADVGDGNLEGLRDATTKWQHGLSEAWNAIFLGNHDLPRLVSRFGDEGEYRRESARMLATFMFTLRGTTFVYQGDEIGMTNPTFDSLDQFQDASTIQNARHALESGEAESVEQIRREMNETSRDNARTPMQWSDSENAGFTTGEPWLTVNDNYPEVNVERELADEGSVLRHYRDLVECRRENPLLVYGRYEPILEDHSDIYAYLRVSDDEAERILVVLNFFDGEPTFALPDGVSDEGSGSEARRGAKSFETAKPFRDDELLIATHDVDASGGPEEFDLRPYEARVYRLS